MKLAFMFSGQGSQYIGMTKDLYEKYECVKEVFDQANEFLGFRLEKIMFEDEEKLNNTKYTQIAMFTMYQAIIKVLELNEINADYAFGLSLGEYGALLYNNVFDFKTGLEIIMKRSELMADAAQNNPGKMSAILGMEAKKLEDLLLDIDGYVKIANYNTYGQLVISGEENAIIKANQYLIENGAKRAIILNTSGAFHSNLMKSAEIGFAEYLKDKNFKEPQKKLLVNLTGDYYNSNIKEVMAKQITSSVRFYQMIEVALKDGVDTFIEIGPKKTLCSFVKKINRDVSILNVEDEASLQNTISRLEK